MNAVLGVGEALAERARLFRVADGGGGVAGGKCDGREDDVGERLARVCEAQLVPHLQSLAMVVGGGGRVGELHKRRPPRSALSAALAATERSPLAAMRVRQRGQLAARVTSAVRAAIRPSTASGEAVAIDRPRTGRSRCRRR